MENDIHFILCAATCRNITEQPVLNYKHVPVILVRTLTEN
jgi:hypothetical protein